MKKFSENIISGRGFSFRKEERLRNKKQIEKLFSEGKTFLFYPLKVIYNEIEFPEPFPAKVAFAVSKKLFKKAVRRNLIRRRMREAYRLNKHLITPAGTSSKKAIFFIYISKEVLDFHSIEKAMQRSLAELAKKAIPNP
jgi:ribonuclease P protein component